MKNLLFAIVCSLSFVVQAQIGDKELSERNWYLTEVNIDGVDVEIPFNDELQQAPMFFEDTTPYFRTTVCNDLEGDLERLLNGQDEFFFPDGLQQTLIECDIQVNNDFEEIYFDFFFDNVAEVFAYSLTIVDVPPDAFYYLEIIVPNGDYIVYGDTPRLNVLDQNKKTFFAVPNPVDDVLSIKTEQTETIVLEVYNVLGKEVLQTTVTSNQQINVSKLEPGMYFGRIITNTRETQIVKFVKN